MIGEAKAVGALATLFGTTLAYCSRNLNMRAEEVIELFSPENIRNGFAILENKPCTATTAQSPCGTAHAMPSAAKEPPQ